MTALILAVVSQGQWASLTPSQVRSLDELLSVYSATDTPAFTAPSISSKLLTDFIKSYALLNGLGKTDGDSGRISGAQASAITRRYFNKSVPNRDYRYPLYEPESLLTARVYRVKGAYPKEFTVYLAEFWQSLSEPEEFHQCAVMSLKAKPGKVGEFIPTSRTFVKKAGWLKATGIKSLKMVRPDPSLGGRGGGEAG